MEDNVTNADIEESKKMSREVMRAATQIGISGGDEINAMVAFFRAGEKGGGVMFDMTPFDFINCLATAIIEKPELVELFEIAIKSYNDYLDTKGGERSSDMLNQFLDKFKTSDK